MKTFDFIQTPISYNPKDPHSKALEPDCPSSWLSINNDTLLWQSPSAGGQGSWGFQEFFPTENSQQDLIVLAQGIILNGGACRNF
jgi:hypothetical protein